MPTSIMQKNYSHCPLKKRPVPVVREEIVKEETYHDMDEPENLSTKPEDLSRTGNYPTLKYSPEPASPVSRSPSPPRRVPVVPSINIPTPVYNTLPSNYHLQQSMKSESSVSWHSPTHSNEQLSYASPTNWHKSVSSVPSPVYANYLAYPGYPPTYHNDHYESLYHNQVSPTRSEQLSPYTQRDSSVSPPAFIPALSSTMVLNGRNHRDSSLSPPILVQPYPMPADLRRASHNHNVMKSEHYGGIHHRYTPYQMGHHHHHPQHQLVMPVDHSSLSPTSSHVSLNSMLSSRRSMSPSSNESTPEDLTSSHSVSVLMEKSSSSANIQKIKKDNCEKLNRSSGAPRYQCKDCGKSYSTYSGLTKHQQFHCPAAENNQEKKTFHCKDCDKVYVSLGALKMHIRTHTLPCKCHVCGKAFSRPWLLQGHIRTHTGEKPFSCNHCNRAFADRSNLRAHLQTHSDVKKYSCTSCSKTFSRMSLLTKHSEGGCPGLQMPNGSNGFGAVNKEIAVF